MFADDASSWDSLAAAISPNGSTTRNATATGVACTNMAESFFSRIRRAEVGAHHHVAGRYLGAYANETAWRENNRRVSNGEQFLAITGAALAHPVSHVLRG